jgi:hypothetical protein
MVSGIDERGVDTLIGYVPSEGQCGEIGKDCWANHLTALKTAEAKKTTNVRSSIQKPATSQIYNCYGKRKDPLSRVVGDYAYTFG